MAAIEYSWIQMARREILPCDADLDFIFHLHSADRFRSANKADQTLSKISSSTIIER
ncbi:MAG: hypothetical protein AB7P14_21880 [Blastocatellales bacterium]